MKRVFATLAIVFAFLVWTSAFSSGEQATVGSGAPIVIESGNVSVARGSSATAKIVIVNNENGTSWTLEHLTVENLGVNGINYSTSLFLPYVYSVEPSSPFVIDVVVSVDKDVPNGTYFAQLMITAKPGPIISHGQSQIFAGNLSVNVGNPKKSDYAMTFFVIFALAETPFLYIAVLALNKKYDK